MATSTLVAAGVTVVAAGAAARDFRLLLAGRMLYGLGSESFYVALDLAYAKWFLGRGLATAVALATQAGRLGDVLSFNTAPALAGALGSYPRVLALGAAAPPTWF
eukprot:tig00000405_g467.t1